jgi:type IV pilus assembly protein PilV
MEAVKLTVTTMPFLSSSRTNDQTGTSLIEVLVTLVIVAIGLLGLAGLQSRLQVSEMEAYQRVQALVLLNDIASRITINRSDAANYVTTAAAPLGAGMTCAVTDNNSTRQERDAAQWCAALQGAAERSGASRVGAMVGARGCIEQLSPNDFLVTVAWQGLAPISAPPASVGCAAGAYNDANTGCVNDLCRRVVTTVVSIATL